MGLAISLKWFLFKLFQTLLHYSKAQAFSFQAIPNSFDKTPGVGGVPRLKHFPIPYFATFQQRTERELALYV
jgi:hypothetical protein